MSISQFFILSARGDTIIYRDFRKDLKKGINELFFRKVSFWKDEGGEAPPIFNIEGINFIFFKKFEMYFVFATKENNSPSYYLEILWGLMKVIKDHCGVLSEESIRKNFILIYEIVDEILDFGYPQLSSTEQVKPFVFTEPIAVVKSNSIINTDFKIFKKESVPSQANQRTMGQAVDQKSKKNEIFVDLFEKLTVLFNSSGNIVNSSIDGCIQMKSYLKGNPELKLVLNDDLTIGNKGGYGSGVVLDDCNFHQCVNTKDFDSMKTLTIIPPDGEFIAMNYRITSDFVSPFRIFTYIEESDYKLELKIKIRAVFSEKNYGGNVVVKFPVPRCTQNVYFELQNQSKLGQSTDFNQNEKMCYWKINKFLGGAEQMLVVKMTLTQQKAGQFRKELGPISMIFEIPMYNVSKLQVKYLKIISPDKNYNGLKWVRYVTQASSYVARTN